MSIAGTPVAIRTDKEFLNSPGYEHWYFIRNSLLKCFRRKLLMNLHCIYIKIKVEEFGHLTPFLRLSVSKERLLVPSFLLISIVFSFFFLGVFR